MKLIILIINLQNCFCANILIIATLPSPSHYIWSKALSMALIKENHNITILTHDHDQNAPNYSVITLEGIYEKVKENFNEIIRYDAITTILSELDWTINVCKYDLETQGLQTLLNYPTDFFDLIIWDLTAGQCLYPLISRFKNPPVMGISPLGYSSQLASIFGHSNPAYVPFFMTKSLGQMDLIERVKNTFHTFMVIATTKYIYLPTVYKLALNKFGGNIPDFGDVERNISLLLSNTDPVLNTAEPLPPNVIPVGGLHIQQPKELPQDLKMIIDNATDGVIYFSVGTIIRFDEFESIKRDSFLKAFSKLPQTVLWKYDGIIGNLPKNVFIRKWLPQNDVLAMSNVKLFITHCGALSSFEAIYHGVPVITIPMSLDQYGNSASFVRQQLGKRIDFHLISPELVYDTIMEVLSNPKYDKNMKELSGKFRDQPLSPTEKAVFWTEYLLRHKNAEYLSVKPRDIGIQEIFLWDIAFLAVLCVLLILIILVIIVKVVCNNTRYLLYRLRMSKLKKVI